MSPCIQAVHTKGQECVRLEAEDADAAACTNLDEVKVKKNPNYKP